MVITDPNTGTKLSLLTTLREVESMVRSYLSTSNPIIFFDTETTGSKGSNKRTDRMVSLQFMRPGGSPVVVDVRHLDNHHRKVALHCLLQPLFSSAVLVGVNLKFDYQMMLLNYNLRISKPWDCMIAEQVLYGMGFSDARSKNISFSFKAMGERRGLEITKETRETFKEMHLTPQWNQRFTNEQLNYMAQDVRELETIYFDQLVDLAHKNLNAAAILEMRVLPAVSEAELNGMKIDVPLWKEAIKQREEDAKPLEEELVRVFGAAILQKRVEKYDAELVRYTEWDMEKDAHLDTLKYTWEQMGNQLMENYGGGTEIYKGWGDLKTQRMKAWREEHPNPGKPKADHSLPNIASPSQLMDAFEVLGIPAKSTRVEVLKMLVNDYPIIDTLQEWRKANKFVVSFGDELLAKIEPATGRLHPTINQIGASTNRMSMENPNAQQFPKPNEKTGVNIRKAVIAEEGNRILTADYSGQELLIIAELSGDENMLRLLDEGADLHSETARLMFGLAPDVDTKKHYVAPSVSARDAAKTINYGIAYGMTKYRLSKVLKCSLETAQSLIDAWFHAYPGVKQWLDNQKVLGEQTLQSRTICGWVRHFDPLPMEPLKPRYTSKDEWKAWNEKHREWEKLRGALHNKAMNTPIQGAGAGMIKLAVSLFFEWIIRNEKTVKITGIVHDEIVVEAPEDQAEEAGEMLVECMDQAAHYYLKRVRIPKSECKIAKYWSK